jgi:spermidine synthase
VGEVSDSDLSAGRPNRAGLFFLAFGSGFSVLAIEIAGARLIAPVFGLSAVPWTAVIGVILTALAIGNHIGGRLADEGRLPLSRILAIAGVLAILPVLGGSVPWLARQLFGFVPGAVVSALVLFAPPVACLGAVVPYLVRADTESLGQIGRRAGDVSASATAGSILGSFLTGFVLLPAMPLPFLMGLTSASLFLMAWLSGRVLREPGSGSALPGVILVPLLGVLASGRPADTLHREQTLYSSVAVTERTWGDGRVVRELWQNGGSSSAEDAATGAPAHVYARTSMDVLLTVSDRIRSTLVLGGAALTLPVAIRDLHPEGRVDVVEIDPAVTELAREYFVFGQPGGEERIQVVHEDARVFLRASGDRYDLVYLDVFDHLLTVPWTMVTREALADMAERLDDDGIFMANVLSPLSGPGTEFLERFRVTLEEVFPAVRVLVTDPALDSGATQNLLVVAAHDAAALPVTSLPDTAVPAQGRVFTDAWAPVEYLQAKVFFQGLRWR